MNNQTAPMLTPDDAAKRIGGPVTARTLSHWRYKGRGPKYVKLGHVVAYRNDDIESWISEHVRDPEAVS